MKKKSIFLIIFFVSLTAIINYKILYKKEEPTEDTSTVNTYKYTGLNSTNNNEYSFMVIVENSPSSRPQSGLSKADIIYETSAEGGIPRFIALFSSENCDKIGPVRSIRPYFIDIGKEFNLPVAHCGGSAVALDTISKDDSFSSINEISNENYFWRDSSRKAPHNLYTSSHKIQSYITDKNINYFNTTKCNFPFSFDNNFIKSKNLKDLNNVTITINKNYNTSYKYEDGSYVKSMDDILAIDANTNSVLNFSNIIIQKTNISLNEDNTHLDIDLNGSGEGYFISQGKIMDILWYKNPSDGKTYLTDTNKNPIKLSTGKTIWHIIDRKTTLNFS